MEERQVKRVTLSHSELARINSILVKNGYDPEDKAARNMLIREYVATRDKPKSPAIPSEEDSLKNIANAIMAKNKITSNDKDARSRVWDNLTTNHETLYNDGFTIDTEDY